MSKLTPEQQFRKFFAPESLPARDQLNETTLYCIHPNGKVETHNNRLEFCERSLMALLNQNNAQEHGTYTIYVAATPELSVSNELLEWIGEFKNVKFHLIFGLLNNLSQIQHLHNGAKFNNYMSALLQLIAYSKRNPDKLCLDMVDVQSYNRLVDIMKWDDKIVDETPFSRNHALCMKVLKSLEDADAIGKSSQWSRLPTGFLENYGKI